MCELGEVYPCDRLEDLERSILVVGGTPYSQPSGTGVRIPVLVISLEDGYWSRAFILDARPDADGGWHVAAHRAWFSEN